MTNNQVIPEPDNQTSSEGAGGDVSERSKSEWNPKGGELFVHSHFFESVDGAERNGLDDVLDKDVVKLFEAVVDFRDENGIDDDLIVPADNKKLVKFYEASMRSLLQNRPTPDGAQDDDRFVIEEGSVSIEHADGRPSLQVEVGKFPQPKQESGRVLRFKRRV